jgi:hypothetical protein
MSSVKPSEEFLQVLTKGSLSRPSEIVGTLGAFLGRSVRVACNSCERSDLKVFMTYRAVDLCLECAARLEPLAYPTKKTSSLAVESPHHEPPPSLPKDVVVSIK